MKMFIAGVSRLQGKARATGNNYDMPRIYVLNPIEDFVNGNTQRIASGYELGEIQASQDLAISCRGFKFPAMYECMTDTIFRSGKAETIVTAIKPVTP